eukprot:g78810.t1
MRLQKVSQRLKSALVMGVRRGVLEVWFCLLFRFVFKWSCVCRILVSGAEMLVCLLALLPVCFHGVWGSAQRPSSADDAFFISVDSDRDGLIEGPELEEFIRTQVGGENYDTPAEAKQGCKNVWGHLLPGAAPNAEKEIALKDWKPLGALLTVNEVAEWVSYGLQLPHLAERFREHSVSGYDLRSFFTDDSLYESLGITSRLQQKQLKRGLSILLLGVSDPPPPPAALLAWVDGCTVHLMWERPPVLKTYRLPHHSFRLQRRRIERRTAIPIEPWQTIWQGQGMQYTDGCVEVGMIYEYKLDCWSPAGHSQALVATHSTAFLADTRPGLLVVPENCSQVPPVHCPNSSGPPPALPSSPLPAGPFSPSPVAAAQGSCAAPPDEPAAVSPLARTPTGPPTHSEKPVGLLPVSAPQLGEVFFLLLFTCAAVFYYYKDREFNIKEEEYRPLSPHPQNPLVGVEVGEKDRWTRTYSDPNLQASFKTSLSNPNLSQLGRSQRERDLTRGMSNPLTGFPKAKRPTSCYMCARSAKRAMLFKKKLHTCHNCRQGFCENCGRGSHRKLLAGCGHDCLCFRCFDLQQPLSKTYPLSPSQSLVRAQTTTASSSLVRAQSTTAPCVGRVTTEKREKKILDSFYLNTFDNGYSIRKGIVIGEQWVFVSSKPDELTGKHNLHLGFKVLVVSEEAVHSTNKVVSNAMKEKITSKRLNINPKFMPLFSVRDPSGLFFNSNHDDTVLVERGDRRYIFFPVSNKFANRIRTTSAQEYFARLHALPDELLAWQLFRSQDPRVDKVDLRRDARYDTEIFWNSAYTSSPLHVQFLYHTVKNSNFLDEVEGPVHWTPKDWHKSYNIWCTLNRNGHFTAKNIVTFEKSLETYLRWDSQAKRLLAGVSQEEQVQHVRAQITGVYNARYS